MSKMPLAFFFLEFALLLCFSKGAPPGKKTLYSREEEEFLIKNLESNAGSYNHNIWRIVAEAHGQKVEEKAPGFLTKRSIKALRSHVCGIMKNKKRKVPDTVKLLRHKKRNKPYSEEEEEFINTELISHEGNVYGEIRWSEIKKKHDEKRELRIPGFSQKRTARGLGRHFKRHMVMKGLVHEDLKERFPDYFKCGRGEGSVTLDGRSQSESDPNENGAQYTSQEQKLIINMLEHHAGTYNRNTWKVIEEAHRKKVQGNDPGFSRPRSAKALYQHFILLMKKSEIEVPDTVKRLYYDQMNQFYTPNEQEFINTELLSCEYDCKLNSRAIWKKIEKGHDRKRESGCLGFTKKRTRRGLHTYFQRTMVPKGLVDEAVKRKFPDEFLIKRGFTSTGGEKQLEPNPSESAENAGDDEGEIWGTILQDLNESQRSPVESTKGTQIQQTKYRRTHVYKIPQERG